MGIPVGAVRVVFTGDLPGGEIWSTGFWMIDTGVTDQDTANAFALLMDGEFRSTEASGALLQTIQGYCSTQVTWTKTTIYAYPAGGPTAGFIGEFTPATPTTGAQAPKQPNQVALVLTTRTGLPGRRHRGRLYLPVNSLTLSADGQVTTIVLDAIVNAWALAFSSLNDSDNGTPVVVSTAGTAATKINRVSADSRMDIQRRRANSQAIDHTSSQVVDP